MPNLNVSKSADPRFWRKWNWSGATGSKFSDAYCLLCDKYAGKMPDKEDGCLLCKDCSIRMRIEAREFKISISCHGQWAIELHDSNQYEHWFLRRAINDPYIDSSFYLMRDGANPFFQGGSQNKEGWLLIEFWQHDKRICQNYVNWLNAVYVEEILNAEKNGILKKGKCVI